MGQDAGNFAGRLRAEGIWVRRWRNGDPEAIRITVGRPEQNDALLRSMKKLRIS